MHLFQQVPQSYLNFLKSGKKTKPFFLTPPFCSGPYCYILGTPHCAGHQCLFWFGGNQAATKGKPILPSPPFHDERKEWVGIFLRKKKKKRFKIQQFTSTDVVL